MKADDDAELVAESFMRMLHGVKSDPAGQEIFVHALRIVWMTCTSLGFVAGALCMSRKYHGFHDHDKNPGEDMVMLQGSESSSSNSPSRSSATLKDLSRQSVQSV